MAVPVVDADVIAGWIGSWLWPFARIGMMLLVMPVFGGRLVPRRVRILLAALVTLLVVPLLPPAPAIEPLSPGGLLILGQQLLIGAAMGLVLQVVFSALVVGGQLVGMSMGLGFAMMVDPQNGINVPVISQYYVTLASLLFLALDGHLMLFSMLAESFRALPVAPLGLGAEDLRRLALWGGQMFVGGVLVGLPVVAALLLANLTFGVITRAAPQLNIFAVGFPATLALGFAVILFALPALLPEFQRMLDNAFGFLALLTGGGRG